MTGLRHWMADELVRLAAARMRRRHPEWADAIVSENAYLSDQPDHLGWAAGSFKASFAFKRPLLPSSSLVRRRRHDALSVERR